MSKPSFPFYPDDWLNDLALRGCSPIARAIWIDLICLMHQGVPYGYLSDVTGPLSMKFLASRCSVTSKQVGLAIDELEKRDVFSRDSNGTIYSRRMVRDEYKRIVRGHGGNASSDHPAVPPKKGLLPIEMKGILSTHDKDPPFDPVEGKGVLGFKLKNKLPSAGNYDPIPGWLRFKAAYPAHRINPHIDMQLWISTVESKRIEEVILVKLPLFVRSEQWAKDKGKFVPAASRFLGERIFDTEPGPEPGPPPKSKQQLSVDQWDQV